MVQYIFWDWGFRSGGCLVWVLWTPVIWINITCLAFNSEMPPWQWWWGAICFIEVMLANGNGEVQTNFLTELSWAWPIYFGMAPGFTTTNHMYRLGGYIYVSATDSLPAKACQQAWRIDRTPGLGNVGSSLGHYLLAMKGIVMGG